MLANQIMMLRKKAGMSQLQLAKKLNIGPSAIGMYEQGRRTPDIEMLIKIADLFEVSLDYLITGKEISESVRDEKDLALQASCPCRACCFRCNKPKLEHINCFPADDIYEGENR